MRDLIELRTARDAVRRIADIYQPIGPHTALTPEQVPGWEAACNAIADWLADQRPSTRYTELERAARYAKDVIGIVLVCPQGHDVPMYLKAAKDEIEAALAALDGDPA